MTSAPDTRDEGESMLTDRQESAPFRQWLEDVRGMSPLSARDVVGRARRAERILGEAPRDLAGQG